MRFQSCKIINITAFSFLLVGCSSFMPINQSIFNSKLDAAMEYQVEIANDDFFKDTLSYLNESDSIDWGDERVPLLNISHKQDDSLMSYLLKGYGQGVSYLNIRYYSHFKAFFSGNGGASPRGDYIFLNKRVLRKQYFDKYRILNLLVHEAMHIVGLKHMVDQSRKINACDFAYVAGDLSEIIMVHNHIREGLLPKGCYDNYSPDMCVKLKDYVEEKKYFHKCKFNNT